MSLLLALIGAAHAESSSATTEARRAEPAPAESAVASTTSSTEAAPEAPATPPASTARASTGIPEAFARCYRARVTQVPELAGKVVVRFEIAPDGSVPRATATSTEIADATFLSCLEGVARQARFSAASTGQLRVSSRAYQFATE